MFLTTPRSWVCNGGNLGNKFLKLLLKKFGRQAELNPPKSFNVG